MMLFKVGVTSQSVDITVTDDSGLPITGKAYTDFPAMLWSLAGANADNTITLATLASLVTAWSSGGLLERGGGKYRLDAPNAIFATLGRVTIRCEGSNFHVFIETIQVVAFDPNDAVRLGLTAFPNVNAGNNGGLPLAVDNSGRIDLLKINGTSQTAVNLGSVLPSAPYGTVGGLANIVVASGTAAAGGSSSITLQTALGADSLCIGMTIRVILGTGTIQTRIITGYTNSTKIVTVDQSWTITPSTDSVYQIINDRSAKLNASGQVTIVGPPNFTVLSISATTGLVSLTPAEHTSIATDVQTGMTAQNYTSSRGLYLDNINIGGAAASHADVVAINTSSSKHIILTTAQPYERPESGSTVYTIESRTYSAASGAAVNADSTPTLTVTGQTSGDLSANLSVATNPATGVYRWTYTVASAATTEPARIDISATISGSVFTLSAYTQILDEVSTTWTNTNNTQLTTIFNKLPANNIADETLLIAAIGSPFQAASDFNSTQKTSIGTALTAQGMTTTRTTYLDNLSGGPVMLASTYTAPNNADIAAILSAMNVNGGVAFVGLVDYSIHTRTFTQDMLTRLSLSLDAVYNSLHYRFAFDGIDSNGNNYFFNLTLNKYVWGDGSGGLYVSATVGDTSGPYWYLAVGDSDPNGNETYEGTYLHMNGATGGDMVVTERATATLSKAQARYAPARKGDPMSIDSDTIADIADSVATLVNATIPSTFPIRPA